MPRQRIVLHLALILFLIAFASSSLADSTAPRQFAPVQAGFTDKAQKVLPYASDRLLVQLTEDAMERLDFDLPMEKGLTAPDTRTGIRSLDVLAGSAGVRAIERPFIKPRNEEMAAKLGTDRWFMFRFHAGQDMASLAKSFQKDPNVEAVSLDWRAFPAVIPNDPYHADNWGHNNTAQLPDLDWGGTYDHTLPNTVGTPGFDANAQAAWDGSQGFGSSSVVIAIIDSGVDIDHDDLRLVTGYDYGDNDSNPDDNSAAPGHGTCCAGVAAARINNGNEVDGIAGGCSVMPLKVADSAGSMYFSSIINAIYHAADNGADIISMSLGADISNDSATDSAILYAYNAGVVILAATSNANQSHLHYPANNAYVIGVGAASPCGDRKRSSSNSSECNPGVSTDPNGYTCDGERWWGSNYGVTTPDAAGAVDVIAPTILPTTDIEGSGGYRSGDVEPFFNGTSCATPYAAGVCALIKSKNPTWTNVQIRDQLCNTAIDIINVESGSGWDRYSGYGMVDAEAAVGGGGPVPPTAEFVGAPTSGSFPLTVDFTDLSSGAPTSWSWTFGDGGTSTAQNPSHTYTAAGYYTVSLTVFNSEGNDTETKTNYINVTNPADTHAALPYSTGFEAGSLDQYWTTATTNEGRIQVSTSYSPHGGSYQLLMDDTVNGGNYSQCEAWLYLNLSGETDVDLEFWWQDFGDETHTQDGVYFSDNDGASFVKVQDLNGGSYTNQTWYNFVLDVDALCSTNGLSMNSTFVVKFQQYDNYMLTTDGFGFDDISVTGVTGTPPVAAFVGSPTSGQVPLTVNFTDQSTGAPTSWSWNFGDGGTSTAQNPSHQYNAAGTYTVTLTATNAYGSDDEVKVDYITVTNPPPPTAAFVGSPTSGQVPLTVNFTDQSTGAPTSWSWVFGDGGTSTAQNPSHQYTAAGTYTVTLTATNAYGSDDEVKVNYITVNPCNPPVAAFTGTPTSGDYPLNVSFTDQSTNSPTSWSWNFGDSGTSTAQNPNHTYTAAGTYTVTLTATNACGSDGETKTNYITVTEPSSGYATLPYSTGFESGSLDSYWSTATTYEGRIQVSSSYSPHGGSYQLLMDDSVNGGNYSQCEAWLHVNLNGQGNVDLDFWWQEFGDETHTQDGIYFSDNGGSSFVKVQDLPGGSTTNQTWNNFALDVDALCSANGLSLTSTFVIKFQQYDNYAIATDGFGFDDISVTGSAGTPPVADFVGSPTAGAAPLDVNFTDQSTGAPTSWSWTFGDGGTSTAQNPSHTYTAAGTYTVSLTVTNAYGSDGETKTDYITVTSGGGTWQTITFDDFEGGWGSYTDGGGDCARYTGGTYAWSGSSAADIQDNSGVASSFYHTGSYNVSGYVELEVEFYFIAISMEANEDFWVQYYDGSSWNTVASFARGIDFNNGTFYVATVTIPNTYNYPTNARLRFMCDASGNADDVYIDDIEFRGLTPSKDMDLAGKSLPLPDRFSVSQNYPNPFNPLTKIDFALPNPAHVKIVIYDIRGRRVATLTDRQYDAGRHTVEWIARDVASGRYIYRIKAGDKVETKSMMLVK